MTDRGSQHEDPRVHELLAQIMALAEGDLDARVELSGAHDQLDAIMLGLNLLAEEIQERDRSLRQAEADLADHARRLALSEASYRVVAAHADGLVVVDQDDLVRFCNRAAVQILDFPYVGGRWPSALLPLLDGECEERELAVGPDGQRTVETRTVPISWEGQPARLVSIRDVTETRALQAELLAAQRMSLVARLAGGVAHDFNNLLATILGNLELIEMLDDIEQARAPLERVRESAERAARLTARLLAVGRRRVGTAQKVDLQQVVEQMRALLVQVVGSLAELEIVHAGTGLVVDADPIQLEQIVLNLVTNARDAVSTGGHISVRTHLVTPDQALPCRCRRTRGDQPLALLEVRDDGEGIPAEHLPRIFDPFWSTRAEGVGTGLGLSTVKGIVDRVHGHVCAESRPEGGTTLRVYLPAHPAAAPAQETSPTPAPATARHTDHLLLVVDDEPSVREVLVEHFRARGYAVLEAASGAEALRLADQSERPVELLLTDVVMPGMDGWELGQELKRRQPEVEVLLMSGYGEAALARHIGSDERVEVLAKPFRLAEVQARVAGIFDRG